MAGWGTITIGAVPYDLKHLDTFVMTVTPKTQGALARRVLVTFGHHVFTQGIRPGDPPEMTVHHKGHNGDPRCFCPVRYGHSLHLPAIIKAAVGSVAYFGETQPWRPQNYFLIDNVPGVVGPYAVFFDMKRGSAKNVDVAMLVKSAYPKPRLPPSVPNLPFTVLVATIAAGKPVVKPKK